MESTTSKTKKHYTKKHRGNGHRASSAAPVEEAVESIGEKAKSTISSMTKSAVDAASYVGDKADKVTTAVGTALEDTGQYLRDDGLKRMLDDVTQMVRRNPVPALLMGIGLGFLVAHSTHRRS